MVFRHRLGWTALAPVLLSLGGGAWCGRVWAAPAPEALPVDVQAQLERLMLAPEVSAGHVGLAIKALGRVARPEQAALEAYDGAGAGQSNAVDGTVTPKHAAGLLWEKDARKRFLPASNMKLFTAAWVLARLGSDFRLSTQVAISPPQATGRGKPSLTLIGGGDPSFTSGQLKELLAKVPRGPWTEAMIRIQQDGLAADQFGGRYPDGWTLDDTLWDYGAPVSGLVVDRNAVDLVVRGTEPGRAAGATLSRPLAFNLLNKVVTGASGSPARITIDRLDGEAGAGPIAGAVTVVVTGTIAPGATTTENLAVPDPLGTIRREVLAEIRDVDRKWPGGPWPTDMSASGPSGLLVRKSAPLKEIVAGFLKPSDNLYGEVLLRRAALSLPPENGENASRQGPGGCYIASTGLASRAHAHMARWLMEQGVDVNSMRFSDGSGLSRYNLITPLCVVQLLEAAAWMPEAEAFYRALPVAGVDGTLRRRYRETAAAGNVRAKTGTFSIANCLSGYVTTQDGHRLAVSILTDFVPDGGAAREWQGKVFAVLAGCRLDGQPLNGQSAQGLPLQGHAAKG